MREQKWRTVAVGAFALTAMLILGFLIILFGESPSKWVGTSYPIKATFARGITSTREGTEVILFGKRVGQVSKVEFSDDENLAQGVTLTLEIESDIDLPVGASAVESMTSAVMGRAVIRLLVRPTAGAALPRDGTAQIVGGIADPLEGILPPGFGDQMSTTLREIGDLAAALRPVALEFEKLIQQRNLADFDESDSTLSNISTLIQRFDLLVKNVNGVIGDPNNQQNLAHSLANISEASKRSIELMDRANLAVDSAHGTFNELHAGVKEIREMIGRFDEMTQGLSGAGIETLEAFSSAAVRLERLAVGIEQGRGTIGLLMNDNRLYEAMLDLAEDLKKTSAQMRSMIVKVETGEVNPIKLF
jgi:ABC-type transporter Mla subunit MlaD